MADGTILRCTICHMLFAIFHCVAVLCSMPILIALLHVQSGEHVHCCVASAGYAQRPAPCFEDITVDVACSVWGILAVGQVSTSQISETMVVHRIPHVHQVRKNSLNIKFLGGIFLGHPGPRRRDIPDKNFMQVAFSVVLDREGRDVPGFGSGRPGFGKTLCKKTLG